MAGDSNKLLQFWQELKRRRVVHVLVVYATAAFVILEAVDIIFPRLNFPDWTITFVMILLAVGFPIALIFSWIFDLTPEGIEKTKPAKEVRREEKTATPNSWKIATFVSIVIIIGLMAFNIFRSKGGVRIDESLSKSIAVLPFHNLSGDYDKEYLCDGLTDEIINHLYKIQSFDKVVPLTSVLNYKDSDKNAPEIAEELKVNYLLSGTYKEIGKRLRITTQLIEPRNDKYIWQHDYDQSYEDIIAIQSDIALQIADHLMAFLTNREKQNVQKIPTSNQEAYDKYLLGKHYFRDGLDKNSMNTAISLFKESIALDPDFAQAHTFLAMCYLAIHWLHDDRNQSLLIESKRAIDAAFKIDPKLPEAYIALAEYYYHGFLDYANALDQLKAASDLMPNHPECSYFTAAVYRRMGDWGQAIIEFENAYETDPASIRNIHDLAATYFMTGKYEEALDLLNSEILRSPENKGYYSQKIYLYLMRDGNTIKAREVLKDAAILNISETSLMNTSFYFSFLLDFYDENYKQVSELLSSSEWEGFSTLNMYLPKSMFQAITFELMGLPEKASAYHDSTRIKLEIMLKEFPGDPRILGALGITYAGLGEKDRAIKVANEAVENYSLDMDALRGLFRIEELALMYMMVEEYDAALEQIEILLSNPGPFSAPLLKLDPRWKPLWDHPEFIRLTKEYSQKGSNNYDS